MKTRLAQDFPTAAIVDLYRCLLNDTVELAKSLDGVDVAIMCPASDVNDLLLQIGDGVRIVAQTGEGLAAGLVSVFARFSSANRCRTIALNSDSPHLAVSVLKDAFEALACSDLVVGPTHDGGYYLVGATASHPGLFASSGMSTENALQELLTRAQAQGLSVQFTPAFYDIDVPADLDRLAADLHGAPARAPRTASWIAEWKLK